MVYSMNYDYSPVKDMDFDNIDWVGIVNSLGIKLQPKRPVLLGMLTDDERFDSAYKYVQYMKDFPRLPKNYVRDALEDQVTEGYMTSLDKAWIVLLANRMMKDRELH